MSHTASPDRLKAWFSKLVDKPANVDSGLVEPAYTSHDKAATAINAPARPAACSKPRVAKRISEPIGAAPSYQFISSMAGYGCPTSRGHPSFAGHTAVAPPGRPSAPPKRSPSCTPVKTNINSDETSFAEMGNTIATESIPETDLDSQSAPAQTLVPEHRFISSMVGYGAPVPIVSRPRVPPTRKPSGMHGNPQSTTCQETKASVPTDDSKQTGFRGLERKLSQGMGKIVEMFKLKGDGTESSNAPTDGSCAQENVVDGVVNAEGPPARPPAPPNAAISVTRVADAPTTNLAGAIASVESPEAESGHAIEVQPPSPVIKTTTLIEHELVYAEAVAVAGSFNEWTPEGMDWNGEKFTKMLKIPSGRYQYKFVVNGEWKLQLASPMGWDQFGNMNNILSL